MLLVASISVQDIRQFMAVNGLPDFCFAVPNTLRKPSKKFLLRSGEIEAVKVHDLVPGRHEVGHELPLGIRTCVDFSQGAEFGI